MPRNRYVIKTTDIQRIVEEHYDDKKGWRRKGSKGDHLAIVSLKQMLLGRCGSQADGESGEELASSLPEAFSVFSVIHHFLTSEEPVETGFSPYSNNTCSYSTCLALIQSASLIIDVSDDSEGKKARPVEKTITPGLAGYIFEALIDLHEVECLSESLCDFVFQDDFGSPRRYSSFIQFFQSCFSLDVDGLTRCFEQMSHQTVSVLIDGLPRSFYCHPDSKERFEEVRARVDGGLRLRDDEDSENVAADHKAKALISRHICHGDWEKLDFNSLVFQSIVRLSQFEISLEDRLELIDRLKCILSDREFRSGPGFLADIVSCLTASTDYCALLIELGQAKVDTCIPLIRILAGLERSETVDEYSRQLFIRMVRAWLNEDISFSHYYHKPSGADNLSDFMKESVRTVRLFDDKEAREPVIDFCISMSLLIKKTSVSSFFEKVRELHQSGCATKETLGFIIQAVRQNKKSYSASVMIEFVILLKRLAYPLNDDRKAKLLTYKNRTWFLDRLVLFAKQQELNANILDSLFAAPDLLSRLTCFENLRCVNPLLERLAYPLNDDRKTKLFADKNMKQFLEELVLFAEQRELNADILDSLFAAPDLLSRLTCFKDLCRVDPALLCPAVLSGFTLDGEDRRYTEALLDEHKRVAAQRALQNAGFCATPSAEKTDPTPSSSSEATQSQLKQ